MRVTVSLRATLGQAAQRALEAAAQRYGQFLGKPVDSESGRIEP